MLGRLSVSLRAMSRPLLKTFSITRSSPASVPRAAPLFSAARPSSFSRCATSSLSLHHVSPCLKPDCLSFPAFFPATRTASFATRAAASADGAAGEAEKEKGAEQVEGEAAEAPAATSDGGDGATVEEGGEKKHVKTKALTKQVKHIMNILSTEAAVKAREERKLPRLRAGDIVAMKVEVPENKRRVSLVRGIVIAVRNNGINSTFRIRRIIAGVGVEMVFMLFSPNIKELKVVDHRRVRRAKLYYLRDKIARMSTVN